MPAEITTLSGGALLYTNLSPSQTAKAIGAVQALGSGTPSQVSYAAGTPLLVTDLQSTDTTLNVALGPSATGDQAIVLGNSTTTSVDITFAPTTQKYVIVGNDAGDRFNLGAQNTTLITGSGSDQIFMTGGSLKLNEGGGQVFAVVSGNSTINQTGTGNLSIDVLNGTNLSLGTTNGNDTVQAIGSATVSGGSGAFVFYGANGSSSTVNVGQGNETLYGGSGSSAVNTFNGATDTNPLSVDVMYGGGTGATNYFTGGAGSDSMVSGAYNGGSATDVFTFINQGAGAGVTASDTIVGFGANDTIDLQGYSKASILNWLTQGGNTDIYLSDGTFIRLANVVLNENTAITTGVVKFT